jgi:hypothetical protein
VSMYMGTIAVARLGPDSQGGCRTPASSNQPGADNLPVRRLATTAAAFLMTSSSIDHAKTLRPPTYAYIGETRLNPVVTCRRDAQLCVVSFRFRTFCRRASERQPAGQARAGQDMATSLEFRAWLGDRWRRTP